MSSGHGCYLEQNSVFLLAMFTNVTVTACKKKKNSSLFSHLPLKALIFSFLNTILYWFEQGNNFFILGNNILCTFCIIHKGALV